MAQRPEASEPKNRARTDGRKPLLVYLDADLIKALKKTALDEDRAAYEIVEEATRDWIKRRADQTAPNERAENPKRDRKPNTKATLIPPKE